MKTSNGILDLLTELGKKSHNSIERDVFKGQIKECLPYQDCTFFEMLPEFSPLRMTFQHVELSAYNNCDQIKKLLQQNQLPLSSIESLAAHYLLEKKVRGRVIFFSFEHDSLWRLDVHISDRHYQLKACVRYELTTLNRWLQLLDMDTDWLNVIYGRDSAGFYYDPAYDVLPIGSGASTMTLGDLHTSLKHAWEPLEYAEAQLCVFLHAEHVHRAVLYTLYATCGGTCPLEYPLNYSENFESKVLLPHGVPCMAIYDDGTKKEYPSRLQHPVTVTIPMEILEQPFYRELQLKDILPNLNPDWQVGNVSYKSAQLLYHQDLFGYFYCLVKACNQPIKGTVCCRSI